MNIKQAMQLQEAIEYLDSLPQEPESEDNEMTIYKNDPKNGKRDYWGANYGEVYLSGYYSLTKLLIDLADGCKKQGYESEVI